MESEDRFRHVTRRRTASRRRRRGDAKKSLTSSLDEQDSTSEMRHSNGGDNDQKENQTQRGATIDQLVARVRQNAATTLDADFWCDKTKTSSMSSDLLECVVRSSFTYNGNNCNGSDNRSQSDVIFLQGQASKILNSCRRTVKEAVDRKEKDTICLHGLCLGLHGVRALVHRSPQTFYAANDSSSKESHQRLRKLEAAIKLMYHILTTSEQCFEHFQEVQSDTSAGECQRSLSYGLAAYETLSLLLIKYTSQSTKQQGFVIQCKPAKFETSGGSFQLSVIPEAVKQRRKGEMVGGDLSLEQLTAVTVGATHAMSRMISKYMFDGLSSNSSLGEPEFTRTMLQEAIECKIDDSITTKLLCYLQKRVIMSWLEVLHSHTSSDTASDIRSYCKQSGRLLWEASVSLDRKKNFGDSLDLRREAVLSLLGGPLADSVIVSGKNFETACVYAYKASISHVQQTDAPTPVSEDSSLATFHEVVGRELDRLAVDESSVYVEYCFYRALHFGTFETESTCQDPACLFDGFPYGYHHHTCSRKESSILALYYLALEFKRSLHEMGEERLHGSNLQKTNRVLERFRKDFVDDASPTSEKRRVLSKLWSLSLHVDVFNFLENSAPDSVQRMTSTLQDIAQVLAEGIGPLAFATLPGKDKKANEATWGYVVESYIRAIFIYERVASAADDKTSGICTSLADKVDVAMDTLVNMLISSKSPDKVSSTEKAAKVRDWFVGFHWA